MKKTLFAALVAVVALSGCIAVPVYDSGPGYAPGYGYYGPPATFSFGYTYHDGGWRHGRHWR